MERRQQLVSNVRHQRERFLDCDADPSMPNSITRQIKENWAIARDTLAEYDARNGPVSILYTAQGNRAQKFRAGL